MANLRISSITVIDSTNVSAAFTNTLYQGLDTGNISIISQTPGVPDSKILSVSVAGNVLNIICQPLTPLAAYFIIFQSTTEILFRSLNGQDVLFVDGITNQQLIFGPIPSENPVQTYLNNFYNGNVYTLDNGSIISSYIQGLSFVLSKSLYDIRQSKNENYLSFTVIDEQKTRGDGPFDRLNEEGAYEVLRVGSGLTAANASLTINKPSFPNYPVSLAATEHTERLVVSSSEDQEGTFNINSLTLTLTQIDVIILSSVSFIYKSSASYLYNINDLGYQILDSKYDPEFAFTYLTLANNQIKLSDKLLNDPDFSTEDIAYLQVVYQFKDTGRIIDPSSLLVDSVVSSGREVLPPLENIFVLKHAPIVDSGDTLGTIGDIIFINPNTLPSLNQPHPAFLYEITFRFDRLPSVPGEYSIDYSSGNVYVYGEDLNQTGTGATPPLAVYLYRFIFKSEIDYVYDPDTLDLVALPNGSLIDTNVNITYSFQEVFKQGVDYQADVHIEVLEERIQNRLVALNAIQPLNFPITDVFRIFNETTGEIYQLLRYTNNQIIFNYIVAPRIESQIGERVNFQTISNELLLIGQINNTSIAGASIFKIFLSNDNIMGTSEDVIGSSFNTTVNFANSNIFIQEIYLDNTLTESVNNSRLTNIGDYQIDYLNGVVWVVVNSDQDSSLGTVSYQRGYISPEFPHLITVNNIYYQINLLGKKNKVFSYINFSDGSVLPSTFDVANEGFLNNNISFPYQISNKVIGTFENATFLPGVSNEINFVRFLFEHNDLLNNLKPINFSQSSSSTGNVISVSSLSFNEYQSVQFDGSNYYVMANTPLLYLSPNITMTISVVRLSDSAQLWDGSGLILLGDPFRLVLSGTNSPQVGDPIKLVYSYTINDASRVVVDYNKGNYYIDYTYLADEIIISYEYGDNVLDFRQSNAISSGDTYFVSYKVGALRNALLKNFGTLIDIPILNSLDVSFARENYRDSLMAAMQSFTEGPTIPSIFNIVNTIVHTPPEIIESAFKSWDLGSSLLSPEPIKTTGNLQLLPAKYDNGVLIDTPGQTITFPVISNLRLEQGSLSTWIIPQWNGLDNQATLTFNLTKNDLPLTEENIFIGPAGYHPLFGSDGYSFSLTLNDQVIGVPNESKDGVFIYNAPDPSGLFNRWYIDVIDGYDDGYGLKNYDLYFTSDGKIYDIKENPALANSISTMGITFLADKQHYLFDFGKDEKSNRFSLFKDESGYMNFRVIDKFKNVYQMSADVSSWKAGQQHFVSTSWALNTRGKRDEMHLFIDGFEVPNIIKYGNKVSPYLHEKFRTINPEEIVGAITKSIVSSTDLIITSGSNVVASSLSFNDYGIVPGGILYVEEPGFDPSGYTISNVNGNLLTLTTPMPITMTNARFTINKTSFDVKTEIDLYPNIIISLLHSSFDGYDLITQDGYDQVSSASTNFIDIGVKAGYVLRINDNAFTNIYNILNIVDEHTLLLDDNMPETATGLEFLIYPNVEEEIPGERAFNPAYQISRDGYDNIVLTILDKAEKNDIVLIRTLGMNHKRIKKSYYVWGNSSNILKTSLPSPILLTDVNIYHILLTYTNIGPSNSTLTTGVFISNLIPTDQPSMSDNGRTLSIYISGDNVDYTTPTTVTINGTIGGVPSSSEVLTFLQNETQTTVNKFEAVNNIQVNCKPIDDTKNCVVIQVKENYPITYAEDSTTVPVIRYSYQVAVGNTLDGYSSNYVTDDNFIFSRDSIGNYLIISSPSASAGQYQIIDVSDDFHTLVLSTPTPTTFTDGIYEILNVSSFRSGFQNGYFIFENANDGYIGDPYLLNQGLYALDYYTYLDIPISAKTYRGFVGSDLNGNNTANCIIDDFNIVSEMLTDTRIGETAATNQETITKDFNSLKALQPNKNTLMLLNFDEYPFTNAADFYLTTTNQFIQSNEAVNDNFGKSIVFTDKPMLIDNRGILSPQKQGTIEFWVNSLFDTANDPNYRFYFDATSMQSENVLSTNNATVKIQGRASEILNVKMQVGDQKIDYFAGGSLDEDLQTLTLNKPLPNQQTPVVVNYIPNGTNGDRISIYKDPSGYVNFDVKAAGIDYLVRTPIYWAHNTWHRLKASYIFNSGLGKDEIKFFVDGYEQGNILFGTGLLFGQGQVFGSSFVGQNTIKSAINFQDTINEFFIGGDYTQHFGAYALIDNLKISDVSRPIFQPFGEPIDVNYTSNLSVAYPVTEDLFTTLLLDFDTLVVKNTNFAQIKNRNTGNFDFTVNIFDSFEILQENTKLKQVIDTLIDTLKPANSRAFINYK